MTENENIEAVAKEIATDIVATRIAKKMARERELKHRFGECKCCGGVLREMQRKNSKECSECSAIHIDDEVFFVFPEWARGKKKFFRQALCLMFQIRGK